MCMFSVCLIDVLQDPLVCLIQRFRQFVKNASYTRRETVSECFQLTVYPTKPASSHERVSNHTAREPYIPSAHSDNRVAQSCTYSLLISYLLTYLVTHLFDK